MKHLLVPSKGVQWLHVHYGRSAGGTVTGTTVNHTMKSQGSKNEYSIHGT